MAAFAPSGVDLGTAEASTFDASSALAASAIPSTTLNADLDTPKLARMTSHLVVAGIAAPALVFAGWQYPGSWKARAFLVATGLAVAATHYHYFAQDGRKLYAKWQKGN